MRAGESRRFWRTLEEQAAAERPQEKAAERLEQAAEFSRATLGPAAIDRRGFLQWLGATAAMAGLAGCGGGEGSGRGWFVPPVRTPEAHVPGERVYFSTAIELGGYGVGVLAETREGRPVRLEGNPDHPVSRGAIDPLTLSTVLSLYDPDRLQTVTRGGALETWDVFREEMSGPLRRERSRGGAGLRILSGPIGSPTLRRLRAGLLAALPGARWHVWDPFPRWGPLQGSRLAFGEPREILYRFDRASTILAIDSDFLMEGPARLANARRFAQSRAIDAAERESGRTAGGAPGGAPGGMSRLYAVESAMTNTGAKADHRLALPPSRIEPFARALAARLGVPGAEGTAAPPGIDEGWIAAVAEDLRASAGRAIVIAGEHQSPEVHALALAMNERLGNLGSTVLLYPPVIDAAGGPGGPVESLRALLDDLRGGSVAILAVLGSNPVYDAPRELDVGAAIERAGISIAFSLYPDETASRCQWQVPLAHPLESWGDERAVDGTVTIVQPMISPLYGGWTAIEATAWLTGDPQPDGHALVRQTWMAAAGDVGATAGAAAGAAAAVAAPVAGGAAFERMWREALRAGVVPGTEMPPISVPASSLSAPPPSATASAGGERGALEILFRPDPRIHDGRFANSAWLQELPKPMTKLTWGNAAILGPALAERLDVRAGDHLRLILGGREATLPVWIQPGQAGGTVLVHCGFGRTRAGQTGDGVGVDVYPLRPAGSLAFAVGLAAEKAGGRTKMASTQPHQRMEGREIVRVLTASEALSAARSSEPGERRAAAAGGGTDLVVEPEETLYPEYAYDGYRWGMTIDESACIGCGACVLACQSENNIPVVGREQVLREREMHWIRVDVYYEGTPENPAAAFQPVPCMQCEKAPCEPVCPVAATTHSDEGLNQMVYNRCIGTRYCSNNCPYKVRRFNFLTYTDYSAELKQLLWNPDVTVRTRGVMEKCTYCVQRIDRARIQAQREGRRIRDGEFTTACAAACPSEAIVFGDLNDRSSRVRARKLDPRNYSLLAELGTQPRTTYLAAVRNPNPALEVASTSSATAAPSTPPPPPAGASAAPGEG